eukprot:CAMPEP_0117759956 /NCGR_PEP_ID=MMETSP0947-20121206/16315_1 /TAXON_ID=44440 /ORGANISM="Chattonella subsalsa, Strain CCMP2191" /LENGTH=532 /DNA_ID=CAMNT_0005580499 /DNA_START=281 /DNA_END=1879 /DNA_ORIENTATION=+
MKRKMHSLPSLLDQNGQKKSKKNRSLPQEAKNILNNWLFSKEHFSDPFPSKEEKKELVSCTGLSLNQINTWFINARRRSWKRKMDDMNRFASSKSPKAGMAGEHMGESIQQNDVSFSLKTLKRQKKQQKKPEVLAVPFATRSTGCNIFTSQEKRTIDPKVSSLNRLLAIMYQSNSGNGLPWDEVTLSGTPYHQIGNQYSQFGTEESGPVMNDSRHLHTDALCQGNGAARVNNPDNKHNTGEQLGNYTGLSLNRHIVFDTTGTTLPFVDVLEQNKSPDENRIHHQAPRIPTGKQSSKPLYFPASADEYHTHQTVESTNHIQCLPVDEQSLLVSPSSETLSEEELMKKLLWSSDENEWNERQKDQSTFKNQDQENFVLSCEFNSSQPSSSTKKYINPFQEFPLDSLPAPSTYTGMDGCQIENMIFDQNDNTESFGGILGNSLSPMVLEINTNPFKETQLLQISATKSDDSCVSEQQINETLLELFDKPSSTPPKSENNITLDSSLIHNGILGNANLEPPKSPASRLAANLWPAF